jgi:hypothetical protein
MIDQSNEMIGMSSAETSKSGPVAIAFSDAKCFSETSSFGEMLLAIAASRRNWRNSVTARSGKIRFRGQIYGTALAAFAVLQLGLTAASAEPCRLSGPRYGLVGDTVQWSFAIERGHSCIAGLRLANVTLDSVKLISQPQSGQVTLSGWGFSYSSAAGIGERDTFTLALVGEVDKKPGGSTVEVAVSIVGPGRAFPTPPRKSPPAQPPIAPFESEAPSPPAGSRSPCPIWDWSKGAPPPMRPPFDRSKLYCPPPPFRPPSQTTGCTCPQD